jgi:hypothetical protein
MRHKTKQNLLCPTDRDLATFDALNICLGDSLDTQCMMENVLRHIVDERRHCVIGRLKYYIKIGVLCVENDKYISWTKNGRRIKRLVLQEPILLASEAKKRHGNLFITNPCTVKSIQTKIPVRESTFALPIFFISGI